MGVFPPDNGAHLLAFHNRHKCDRIHGVCVFVCLFVYLFVSQAAVRESTIDSGGGGGTYGEQKNGEELAQTHTHSHTRPFVRWTGKGHKNG